MSRIQSEIIYPVDKFSDVNHSRNSVVTDLYNIKTKKHKLISKTISYLCKFFRDALRQNKNDSEAIRAAVQNIVPHVFDEHTECGKWCNHKKGLTTKYPRLLYG